jgi:hypothetical protein
MNGAPPARRRGERGFTLVEVVLAVGLAGLVVVPVLSWLVLGYRAEDQLTRRSHDDEATSFLALDLPRDVASATAAARTGPECPPGAGSPYTPPTEVVLSLVSEDFGSGSHRTVYSVAEQSGPTGRTGVLLRRVCTNDGAPTTAEETELTDQLVEPPDGWGGMVVCAPRPGRPDAADPCGRITLRLTGPSGVPSEITAQRRTTGVAE